MLLSMPLTSSKMSIATWVSEVTGVRSTTENSCGIKSGEVTFQGMSGLLVEIGLSVGSMRIAHPNKKLATNKLKVSRMAIWFFIVGMATCYLFRVCVIVSILSARLPKTPFTKRAELSVPKAFASSTASLIPTLRGVFR